MDIERYLKKLKANNSSQHNIDNYRKALKRLNEYNPLESITEEDLVKFFEEFEGTDSTRALYQVIIKKFFRDNGKPELVNWIKVCRIKDTRSPSETLTTEDINALIDATDNPYYKAWVTFAFESGARFSEIQALEWSNFKETDQGMICEIPTSKTQAGFRRILLPLSAGYIRNLKLYSKDDKPFSRAQSSTHEFLKELGKKAGINKPVHPHAFRHAQATEMVLQGYNEMVIRKKLGWTPRSTMPARYQHLHDDAVVQATLEKNGKAEIARPVVKMKEAEPVNLVDASMHLAKLAEENEELRSRLLRLEGGARDLEELKVYIKTIDLEELKKEFEKAQKDLVRSRLEAVRAIEKLGISPEKLLSVLGVRG